MLKTTPDFTAARFHMVECQLRPNKVRDERILTAMETLPREIFVPSPLAGIAYIDEDIQVSTNRYLLEPMVLARLLEETDLKPTDHVLDIAAGTGYSTAVLAKMALDVVGLETDTALQKQAVANLASLQITNAIVEVGPLAEGYKHKAPYDVILINGCVDFVPDTLVAQLAEGGRLLTVVRHFGPNHASHTAEARVYEKIRGLVSHRSLFDAHVKMLVEFTTPPHFKF